MSAQHTPAPWYVERKYEGSCTVAIMRDWSKAGVALAVHGPQAWIHAEGVGPHTVEANARLIAAAPEMLVLLHAAYHALESYRHGNGSPSLAASVAVAIDLQLAKAEGRS